MVDECMHVAQQSSHVDRHCTNTVSVDVEFLILHTLQNHKDARLLTQNTVFLWQESDHNTKDTMRHDVNKVFSLLNSHIRKLWHHPPKCEVACAARCLLLALSIL